MKKTTLLTTLILVGVVLGALIGHFFLWDPNAASGPDGWRTFGDFILMRPLKLIAAPLIFTSVLLGVASLGDPKKLGVLGGATLVYYVSTMVLAVGLGVTLAAVIEPGSGVPQAVKDAAQVAGEAHLQGRAPAQSGGAALGSAWREILELLVPDNFLRSASDARYLSIITVALALGVGLLAVREKAKPFLNAVEALHEALMALVRWILWVMPVGVLALVAWSVGTMGLGNLAGALAKYVVVVLVGLGIHAFVTLPLVLRFFGRTKPYKYMWDMRPALFTAFGTASSMATLPVTIETATDHAGCSKRAAGLVLPLGATINMDGTALYQGVAVIFMFQAFGYDLHFAQYLVIVLTATLAAVGAAGIPAGGLVTTIIIVSAVNSTIAANDPNIPALPLAAGLGLILSVDRVLDMCRTAVNVWGDAAGARIMTRLAPDTELHREKAMG